MSMASYWDGGREDVAGRVGVNQAGGEVTMEVDGLNRTEGRGWD